MLRSGSRFLNLMWMSPAMGFADIEMPKRGEMLAATRFCWRYLCQVLFKLSKSFILEQKSGYFSVNHEGEHRIALRDQRLAIIVQKQAAAPTEIRRLRPCAAWGWFWFLVHSNLYAGGVRWRTTRFGSKSGAIGIRLRATWRILPRVWGS